MSEEVCFEILCLKFSLTFFHEEKKSVRGEPPRTLSKQVTQAAGELETMP
jgi:hypothetical protein